MHVDVGAVMPEMTAPEQALPDVAGLARFAEQAGLDCVWAEDRLLAGEMSVLDSTLTLAAAAAVTDRIALGFSVFVPSLRPLAWAAKQIASLQHIAGSGRLRLGVGLGGGSAEEYHAAGLHREHRARRTDEFLRLLPGLLGGQPTPIPEAPGAGAISLRPAMPVPPLWVGGQSLAALRRAVRFGDGWLSGFQTPGEFAASAARLGELAEEAGRPTPRLGICVHVALGGHPAAGLADIAATGMQRMFGLPADRARQLAIGGTPRQVADHLAPYQEAGAQLLAITCQPGPTEHSWELLAGIRRLLNQS
jgi:alkanesulfonate monooxygenase SsuD/methylene tetrahydromethanopterin reductase-like flavin-dependent oxidoreductase (luciferase family)